MKYLALLLSLLMQVLTCLPCSDTEECRPVTAHVANDGIPSHEDHRHENERCSPFCVCSCCAAVTVCIPEIYPLMPVPEKFETAISYIMGQEQFHSHEDQKIWQPPQLS